MGDHTFKPTWPERRAQDRRERDKQRLQHEHESTLRWTERQIDEIEHAVYADAAGNGHIARTTYAVETGTGAHRSWMKVQAYAGVLCSQRFTDTNVTASVRRCNHNARHRELVVKLG